MRHTAPVKPKLQRLEPRDVPAVVRVLDAGLFVLDPEGDLTLTLQGADQVQVADDNTDVTVTANGRIFVVGTQGGAAVTLDRNGNDFDGDITLDLKGGDDTLTVTGAGSAGGDFLAVTGGGSDVADLGGEFKGDVTLIDRRGADTLTLGAAAGPDLFLGDFRAIGFNAIAVSEAAGGAKSDTFGGSAEFTNAGDGLPVAFTADADARFAGGLSVRSGNGDDTVLLNSEDAGTDAAFGGDVTIDLGNGDSTVFLTAAATQTFEESLFVKLGVGDGQDSVGVNTNVFIEGNFDLNAGDGQNKYDLGSARASVPNPGPFDVGGDLRITGGNGEDSLNFIRGVGAFIGGDLISDLGEGLNSLGLRTGNGASVGGRVVYIGGNDSDDVNLSSGIASGDEIRISEVDITFGNGKNNSIVLGDGNAGGDTFGRVNIRLGNGPGTVVAFQGSVDSINVVGGNAGTRYEFQGPAGGEDYLDVNLQGGNGNDTVTFEAGVTVSGTFDGDGGTNDLDDQGAIIVPPFTVRNFT